MEDMEIKMFNNVYENKKVLVTGNTGFKGSWLCTWLLKLGARVYGISNEVPTKPAMFEVLSLQDKTTYYQEDVNNLEGIVKIIQELKPDFVFHLAAQPIVSRSYKDPVQTIKTNVIGTANVLEALRLTNCKCYAVMISSDKCYENVEWKWGYRESDHLGGKDPYSASKGACEIVIHSYFHSFFSNPDSKVNLVSVRAGNVIGGGDWAENRLVPDCIRAWSEEKSVEIRNPYSTRPWQHVLEPLSGYLRAGQVLFESPAINGQPYNFGPPADQVNNVLEILQQLDKYWEFKNKKEKYSITQSSAFHEAGLLKLNCDKALVDLKWRPVLNFELTTELTVKWYHNFYYGNADMFSFTNEQIEKYCSIAKEKGLEWLK
jgi:CDP-glucose 4,6-dehydratase